MTDIYCGIGAQLNPIRIPMLGLYVYSVAPDSDLKTYGITVGDIITKAHLGGLGNGNPWVEGEDLLQADTPEYNMFRHTTTGYISLVVSRNGVELPPIQVERRQYTNYNGIVWEPESYACPPVILSETGFTHGLPESARGTSTKLALLDLGN